LLIRQEEVLLQLRAPWVHNGGTWGIPGGARDSHESWTEAALREAEEEIGISPASLTLVRDYIDDHFSWSYVTVIAQAFDELIPGELNHETMEVRSQWMRWNRYRFIKVLLRVGAPSDHF
jgi:8-oxo-dGTP diphosphatase